MRRSGKKALIQLQFDIEDPFDREDWFNEFGEFDDYGKKDNNGQETETDDYYGDYCEPEHSKEKNLAEKTGRGESGEDEIDFVDNLNESGFKFNNPNAQKECGCGKSFK